MTHAVWRDTPNVNVLSVLWGWRVDGIKPDLATVVGAAICLAGVGVIMYWPYRG